MKLRNFHLQAATILHQIATRGRPSLATFSRKNKHEHKQPTIPVDVQKDDAGNMPIWNSKPNRCCIFVEI